MKTTNLMNLMKVAVLGILLTFGVAYIHAQGTGTGNSWTPPTMTPPSGNVDAPVNVGSSSQIKSGSLNVSHNFSVGFPNSGSMVTIFPLAGGGVKPVCADNAGVLVVVNCNTIPSGTARDQTLRWYEGTGVTGTSPSRWMPSSVITNDGTDAKVNGSFKVTNNVEIGTSGAQPTNSLAVNGNIEVSGKIINNNLANSSPGHPVVCALPNGTLVLTSCDTGTSLPSATTSQTLYWNGSAWASNGVINQDNVSATIHGNTTIGDTSARKVFTVNGTSELKDDANIEGDLKVGTIASPTSLNVLGYTNIGHLNVPAWNNEGDLNVTGDTRFNVNSGNTVIGDNGGNPTAKLTVKSLSGGAVNKPLCASPTGELTATCPPIDIGTTLPGGNYGQLLTWDGSSWVGGVAGLNNETLRWDTGLNNGNGGWKPTWSISINDDIGNESATSNVNFNVGSGKTFTVNGPSNLNGQLTVGQNNTAFLNTIYGNLDIGQGADANASTHIFNNYGTSNLKNHVVVGVDGLNQNYDMLTVYGKNNLNGVTNIGRLNSNDAIQLNGDTTIGDSSNNTKVLTVNGTLKLPNLQNENSLCTSPNGTVITCGSGTSNGAVGGGLPAGAGTQVLRWDASANLNTGGWVGTGGALSASTTAVTISGPGGLTISGPGGLSLPAAGGLTVSGAGGLTVNANANIGSASGVNTVTLNGNTILGGGTGSQTVKIPDLPGAGVRPLCADGSNFIITSPGCLLPGVAGGVLPATVSPGNVLTATTNGWSSQTLPIPSDGVTEGDTLRWDNQLHKWVVSTLLNDNTIWQGSHTNTVWNNGNSAIQGNESVGNLVSSAMGAGGKLTIRAEGNSMLDENSSHPLVIYGDHQALLTGVTSGTGTLPQLYSGNSYIQSVRPGLFMAPLVLNPKGGEVRVGSSNTSPAKLFVHGDAEIGDANASSSNVLNVNGGIIATYTGQTYSGNITAEGNLSSGSLTQAPPSGSQYNSHGQVCYTGSGLLIQCPPVPHGNVPNISTPGTHTFTIPSGVYTINIEAWGGGGGGGGGSGEGFGNFIPCYGVCGGTSGSGGGAGGFSKLTNVNVTPGDILTINVGSKGLGGTGGSSDYNATSHPATYFKGYDGYDGTDTIITSTASVLPILTAFHGEGGLGGLYNNDAYSCPPLNGDTCIYGGLGGLGQGMGSNGQNGGDIGNAFGGSVGSFFGSLAGGLADYPTFGAGIYCGAYPSNLNKIPPDVFSCQDSNGNSTYIIGAHGANGIGHGTGGGGGGADYARGHGTQLGGAKGGDGANGYVSITY
ncbi:MAG: hypothetical protein NTZ44_00880 [Candidatus Nomurabacteria bacterium]|nr:hypothetical protein [Candidatus Nomurabacteria bacterium]